MGFMDDLKADMATILADFGVPVVYTPSDTLVEPFTLNAVVSRVDFDDPEPGRIRDMSMMRVRHADLLAGGVSDPITRAQKTPCDMVTIHDENGADTIWAVLEAEVHHGWWTFTIERKTRLQSS